MNSDKDSLDSLEEKLQEAIKTALLSEEMIEVDNSLLHKGQCDEWKKTASCKL